MKRVFDSQELTASPAKRPARPDAVPTSPASLDLLVRSLADGSAHSTAPPVWSSHTNLLALALPPPPQPSLPLFAPETDPFAPPPPLPRLSVQLTHLASAGAAHPRVSTRLDVSLPIAFPAAGARVSLLSFAPDGSQLLVAVSAASDAGVDDLVTVFEQRSSCIDEWACVLQESVGRFGGVRSGAGAEGKRVVSTRWVGEPRRWYPSPTFPDAREQSKKPLYCAPPRSAPLSGTAFVAVLSSEELLFVHLPNASTSPAQPGVPAVLPSAVCLPLRPSPTSLAPPRSDASPAPAKAGLTLTAVPTPPTPLPLTPALSTLFPPPPIPTTALGTSATVDTPTPQATIDALVTSLLPTLPSALDAATGVLPASAPAGAGGKSALQDELRLAFTAAGAECAPMRRVGKAAVGASRCRGEGAETVFVVAYSARAVRPTAGALVGSRRGSRVKPAENGAEVEGEKEGEKQTAQAGGFDDDFALLADFTSLDEAFGAPAPPATTSVATGEVGAGEAEEDKAELDAWTRALEQEQEEGTTEEGGTTDEDKWRVELAEVRIEMSAMEGPRLTVRPQPPLYLNPSPASPNPDSASPADPLLTHLTFLGDVSLPHPLQLTSHSPSLASDGSEPAVDLCLLAVVAHPSSSSAHGEEWRSTLTSYALSREEAYPLSEAFHTLEGRKLDAPNAVEGEGAWAARQAASTPVGRGGEGVLCAVEIRPGGGEWASVVGVVAEPKGGEGEGWRTRVLRLSSLSLEPLDKMSDGAEDELAALTLPGGQLFSALTTSPNGALFCAIPFGTAPPQPVLAASPLGRPVEQTQRLATRLAIGIARQGDVGDLVGRVRGLGDAESTLSIVSHTYGILRAMVPAEAQLDASALGMELLGVSASLFRGVPELQERAETAERMLDLAACARAFKRAERRERGALVGAWKPDFDAVWPLVGHCVWFCGPFLDGLLASALASATAPAILLFLHPLFRTLLGTTTTTVQQLNAYLTIEGVNSEGMDLARSVVEDAVTAALDGRGLGEWSKVLVQINGELDGGPALQSLSPPLLASLSVPPALEAQATAARNVIAAAFPSLAAPPTPPRTPHPGWDAVRRARLPAPALAHGGRICLRCGRRTRAFDEPVLGEGRWRRFEAEWEGRCVCGGMWTRVREGV